MDWSCDASCLRLLEVGAQLAAAFIALGVAIGGLVAWKMRSKGNAARLKVATSVSLTCGTGLGGIGSRPEKLSLSVIVQNPGPVDVVVTGFRWEVPILRRVRYQIPDFRKASKFPIEVKTQRNSRFSLEFAGDFETWRQGAVEMLLKPWPRVVVHFARLTVFTAGGDRFRGRLHSHFKRCLVDGLQRP